MMPIVLLVAVIALPLLWLQRKLQGKNFSPTRMQLNDEEMHVLERASHDQSPVSINDKEYLLRSFVAEEQHIHSNCGSCPDELHLDDIKGRARLTASRELGSVTWRVAAMEPVAWGLLGYTSSDLTSLRIGDQLIGQIDDAD